MWFSSPRRFIPSFTASFPGTCIIYDATFLALPRRLPLPHVRSNAPSEVAGKREYTAVYAAYSTRARIASAGVHVGSSCSLPLARPAVHATPRPSRPAGRGEFPFLRSRLLIVLERCGAGVMTHD